MCGALKNPTWRPAGHSPLRFAASRARLHASRSGRSAAQRSVACNRSCDSTVVSCPSSIFVLRCWAWCCGEASLRRESLPKVQMDGHQYLRCRWMGTIYLRFCCFRGAVRRALDRAHRTVQGSQCTTDEAVYRWISSLNVFDSLYRRSFVDVVPWTEFRRDVAHRGRNSSWAASRSWRLGQ